MTKEQREEILKVYVLDGYEAAKPLAIKYGVKPYYIAELASRRGFKENRARRFRHDPRWKRAAVIGEVRV